jgi:hypothetical protein
MLSLMPKVSVFREAVYDSEIEHLKADASSLVGKMNYSDSSPWKGIQFLIYVTISVPYRYSH